MSTVQCHTPYCTVCRTVSSSVYPCSMHMITTQVSRRNTNHCCILVSNPQSNNWIILKLLLNTARVPATFRRVLSGHLREVAEPGVLLLDRHDRIVSTEFKARICDTFLGLCPPFVPPHRFPQDPSVLAKFENNFKI